MQRSLIKILQWVLLALLLLMIGLGVSVALLNQGFFNQKITQILSRQLGRNVVIDSNIFVSYSLNPTLTINRIKLANAAWGTRPWSVKAESVTVKVSLKHLIKGRLRLEKMALQQPLLWLEQDPQGRWNLDFKQQSDRLAVAPTWLELGELTISGGVIGYRHARGQGDFVLDHVLISSNDADNRVSAQLSGLLAQRTFNLQLETGTLEQILSRRRVPLKITATLDQSVLAINGNVADLLSWRGIDAIVGLELDNLGKLSDLTVMSLPSAPLKAVARFIQPQDFGSAALDSIKVETNWRSIPVLFTGRIDSLQPLAGVNIELTSDYNSSAVTPVDKAIYLPGQLSIAARLQNTAQNLGLTIDSFNWQTQAGSVSITGAIADVMADWQQGLQVTAEFNDLSQLGEIIESELPPFQQVKARANLVRNNGNLELTDIGIEIKDPVVEMTVQGDVDRLQPLSGQLEVQASTTQLSRLSQLMSWQLHQNILNLGALHLAAEIKLAAGKASITQSLLSAEQGRLKLSAVGVISDLGGSNEVDLKLQFTSAALDPVINFLPPAWHSPALLAAEQDSINLQANLKGSAQSSFRFEQIGGRLQSSGLRLALNGSIARLGSSMQAKIGAELTVDDLSVLPVAAYLQRIKDLKATALLHSKSSSEWRLEKLNMLAGVGTETEQNIKLSGQISQIVPLTTKLMIELESVRPAEVLPVSLIPWLAGDEDIAQNGRIDATFNLNHSPKQSWTVDHIDAALRAEGVDLKVSGKIKRPLSFQGALLDIALTSDSLYRLPGINKKKINPVGPLRMNMHLDNIKEQPGAELDIAVGRSKLEGRVDWNRQIATETVPFFDAKMTSALIDLDQIISREPNRQRLFSTDSLPIAWFSRLNGRLQLQAAQFVTRLATAKDASLSLSLDNGALNQNLKAHIGNGQIEQHLYLDSRSLPFQAVFNISGDELAADEFRLFEDPEFLNGGQVKLSLVLAGVGNSIAQILGTSNGNILIGIENSKIKNSSLDAFGGDMFLKLVTAINPFAQRDNYIDVECGVFNFAVNDGLASGKRGIAFKTKRVSILGGGEINLGSEQIKFLIKPKARAGVGINTASIAKIVRVGGTVAAPEIETDPRSLLATGTAIGAALATSGLTLLVKGLFDLTQTNDEVCEIVAGSEKKRVKAKEVKVENSR